MFSSHLSALATSAGAAATVLVLGRRSTAAGIGATLLALVASNSSLAWLKHPFLTARWAALLTLAVLVVPAVVRVPRPLALRLASLAILPGLALVSCAWSVEPRLTFERAVSFGIMLWVVVACGVCWARDARALRQFLDAIACTSLVVLGASLIVAETSQRGYLNGQMRGVFENPNGLGLFLGLTYPFVAGAMERRRFAIWRLVVAAIDAAVGAASDSRSGLIALVIVAIGFELSRRRVAWAGICALGALGVAIGMLLTGGSQTNPAAQTPAAPRAQTPAAPRAKAPAAPKAQTPTPPSSSNAPTAATGAPSPAEPFTERLTGARIEAWRATVRFVEDRPVLGYGFGTGDRIFALYPKRVHFLYFEGANPADAYLQLLLELGAVGAAVFLLPLLGACAVGVRAVVAGQNLEGVCCGLALVAGLAVGFVESVFTSAGAPWALLIWLAAAGCLAAVAGPGRDTIGSSPGERAPS